MFWELLRFKNLLNHFMDESNFLGFTANGFVGPFHYTLFQLSCSFLNK